jgi:ribosomal protein L29
MKTVTGQLEDTSTVWKLRKDLARVKTLQTQGAKATAKSEQRATAAK